MLHIDKGEKIVDALISNYIFGTGFYKFLSKQKADKNLCKGALHRKGKW
jgi:hypothetical protein